MDLSKYVGDKIKYYRKLNNLTQGQLALKLNTTNQTISRYESGQRKANQDVLFALCELFNVTIDDFFPIEQTTDIQALYNQLTTDRQEKAYNYIEQQLLEQKNNVVQFPKDTINENDNGTAYLFGAISAGTGEFVPDYEYMEKITVKGHVPIHDIALTVNGNSMEPLFKDKEIVYIEKTKDVKTGQIGAFIINGDAYLKKLYIEDDHARLVSLNKQYDDIIVTADDTVKVIGKVII